MKQNAYKQAIHDEMKIFAQIRNSIFLGQQVGDDNFYGTLQGIHWRKRIEMPVAEELQMGQSIGLALEGFLPISIYQRMDFLLRAADQIVNHLSVLPKLSEGKVCPKVLIRTTVGSSKPLDTGLQHKKDLYYGFKILCDFPVIRVKTADQVHKAYQQFRDGKESMMVVEYQDKY